MTTTVKGAGRSRAAARTKKVDANKRRVDEINRERAVDERSTKQPAKKAAPKKRTPTKKAAAPAPSATQSYHDKVQAFADAASEHGWDVVMDKKEDDSEHVTATRGKEVIHIFWLNGVYQKWATHTYDDGNPSRVQNAKSGYRLLEADAGEANKAAAKRASAPARRSPGTKRVATDPEDTRSYSEQAAERFERNTAVKVVPWEGDPENYSDEELVAFLDGKSIDFVSRVSGEVQSARIMRNGRHTKIGHGETGPYITFAEVDGPFLNIALSRIIRVS